LRLPEKLDVASVQSFITALDLRARFPKECEEWDRRRNEIERRFQELISQRKAEIHAKIEQDTENNRHKVQRAVVSELLKAFP